MTLRISKPSYKGILRFKLIRQRCRSSAGNIGRYPVIIVVLLIVDVNVAQNCIVPLNKPSIPCIPKVSRRLSSQPISKYPCNAKKEENTQRLVRKHDGARSPQRYQRIWQPDGRTPHVLDGYRRCPLCPKTLQCAGRHCIS